MILRAYGDHLQPLGSFVLCGSAMLFGFCIDLVDAPYSPDICGNATGLGSVTLLHMELFPFMHLAMAIGLFEPGAHGRSMLPRIGHVITMSIGMALGGALMRTAAISELGWWPMYAAMLAGMAGGQWAWHVAQSFDLKQTLQSAVVAIRRVATGAPRPKVPA